MRLERAIEAAACSLLFAGLGQLLQQRRVVAFWHFLEVASLLVLSVIDDAHRHLWIGAALAVNAWSVIDAFIWETHRLKARAS